MEQRQDLLLRVGAQINEDVAAGDEVEPREGRVGKEILNGEDKARPR
jgi:hypothetical protein